MPNWCDNMVTLRHEDKTKVDALCKELEGDQNILNHLRPNPTGEWQYDWSIENWGTKWDASIIDWERREDNEVWISFDSAWSPPTRLYEYIVEQGWDVDAVYYEPGMGYGGIFTTDGGDDYYEYDLSDPESIENLPGELIEFGDLRTKAEEHIIYMLEEEWSGAERTEWFPADVKPAYDGYYELQVKGYEDRIYEQFCDFKDGSWNFWNTDNIVGWRGLMENPNA